VKESLSLCCICSNSELHTPHTDARVPLKCRNVTSPILTTHIAWGLYCPCQTQCPFRGQCSVGMQDITYPDYPCRLRFVLPLPDSHHRAATLQLHEDMSMWTCKSFRSIQPPPQALCKLFSPTLVKELIGSPSQRTATTSNSNFVHHVLTCAFHRNAGTTSPILTTRNYIVLYPKYLVTACQAQL
jgi:hypothetical protein